MKTLTAMDTKSVVGKGLVEAKTGSECTNFRNGDHTTTMIRTENGKVIEIQHNVMTPQPYNRLYQLTGVKGFANKYPTEGYALGADQLSASGVQPKVDNLSSHGFLPQAEMDALVEKYQHPILKKYGEIAKEVGGHGVWYIVCRMVCLWIWMCMTLPSGVHWPNWVRYLWTITALP